MPPGALSSGSPGTIKPENRLPGAVITHGPEETQRFGEAVARVLRRGSVVALSGELGSGKTCLVQGICRGLGVADRVNSPTFVIASEYGGRLVDGTSVPVYHLDLYRIERPADLDGLGWEEYVYGQGVCLVEWSERASQLLPEDAVRIALQVEGETRRHIRVTEGREAR